jgi:hypothetical protein
MKINDFILREQKLAIKIDTKHIFYPKVMQIPIYNYYMPKKQGTRLTKVPNFRDNFD